MKYIYNIRTCSIMENTMWIINNKNEEQKSDFKWGSDNEEIRNIGTFAWKRKWQRWFDCIKLLVVKSLRVTLCEQPPRREGNSQGFYYKELYSGYFASYCLLLIVYYTIHNDESKRSWILSIIISKLSIYLFIWYIFRWWWHFRGGVSALLCQDVHFTEEDAKILLGGGGWRHEERKTEELREEEELSQLGVSNDDAENLHGGEEEQPSGRVKMRFPSISVRSRILFM